MITRSLNLLTIIEKNESVLLFGARGTGKTSLIRKALQHCQMEFLYFDLLKIDTYRAIIGNPKHFYETILHKLKTSGQQRLLVVIDEVQKIPELLNEVHHFIEEFPKQILFMLSGSSARKLKKEGANLLAGRAWSRKLFPLSSLETDLSLHEVLKYGALPKAYLADNEESKTEYLKSYVDTYLREEILQESVVRQFESFSRFLDLAGQLNSEPVNFSKLAKQLSLNPKTAQNYFQILIDTLIAHELPGWSTSVKKQLLQAPKFYFFDVGILNAINGELGTELKISSFRYGKLFETFLINEMIHWNQYLAANYRFSYWRTSTGKEVDLIISRKPNQPEWAIEIKSSTHPSEDDVLTLALFKEEYPLVKTLCLCQTEKSYMAGATDVMPWRVGLDLIFGRTVTKTLS